MTVVLSVFVHNISYIAWNFSVLQKLTARQPGSNNVYTHNCVAL